MHYHENYVSLKNIYILLLLRLYVRNILLNAYNKLQM